MDGGGAVRLESAWVSRTLRHPWLRLLSCGAHLVATFFLCGSSPLAASLRSPAHVPVFGRWLQVTLARPSWAKGALHLLLSLLLVAFLRLVAFRALVQRKWNWRRATQLRTRAPAAVAGEWRVVALAELAVVGTAARRSADGSWTFVAACFPFLWAAVAWVLERALAGSALHETLFSVGDALPQLRAQALLSQALLVLSTLKLLMTADLLLQDTHFSRALFGNWLVRVRRAYVTHPGVRLALCWLTLAALGVGGVYFQVFWRLQQAWVAFNLGSESAAHWFSNESWNALLSGAVVTLDVLWLVQDFGFPGFATPVGVKIFGLPVERLCIKLVSHVLTSCTSKWAAGFVVLGLLLPLEVCHFVQIVTYAPSSYAQYVDAATHRVRPRELLLPAHVTATEARLLREGAISRYFEWSAWERVPALGLVLAALALAAWLWREERFKVRAVPTQHQQEEVPADTRAILSKQQQLRRLYAQRSRSDDVCIALAALSVVSVVLQFRSIWRSLSRTDDASESSRPLEYPGEAYGVLLFALTCGLVYQLYQRYTLKLQLMVLRNELPAPAGSALRLRAFPRQLLAPFVVELVLCSVCLPPFLHSSVELQETRYQLPAASSSLVACPSRLTLSTDSSDAPACDLGYSYPLEIINMLVLARLYWCVRIPRNRLLKRVVGEHLLMTSDALRQLPIDSLRWSFRVAFKLAPGRLLLTLFAFFWAGTAAAVSIFERPFPSPLDNEEHSLWMTIVTMSTVGYGDAYPMTALGRVSTFLGAVVGGAVLVSLMTSVFLDSMNGSKEEHKVLGTMARVQWQKRMWHAGAVLIASSWRYHRVRSARPTRGSRIRTSERQLVAAAHQFKLLRKRKPKETYDSLEALKVGAVAHWRTHELEQWIADARMETQTSLDALENDLTAIEASLRRAIAA